MDKSLSGHRILVVEDEMLNLAMLEDILTEAGYESVAAATIDQAIALIDERPFDAALLDIKLKGEHTYAVADALAVRGAPFVFVTGNSVPDIERRYHDRPLLRKPFKEEKLIEVLTGLFPPR
ncbi:MAG: response regulator [Candidatus Cybelea sp.]